MARKYAYRDGKAFGWAMEVCEERLLIASYHQIEDRIRPGERWPLEFREHFYHFGQGVSERFLALLNQESRRCELTLFVVSETTVCDYAMTPDRSWKAKARQDIRDEYLALSADAKNGWIAEARSDMALLPSPAVTFAEYIRRPRPNADLSSKERQNRQDALSASQPQAPPVPIPNFERAIRVMNLATDENTIGLILRSITPDEALLIAETGRITNPTILTGLLERSIDPIIEDSMQVPVLSLQPRDNPRRAVAVQHAVQSQAMLNGRRPTALIRSAN